MLRLYVPIFRWNGHVEKNPKEMGILEKTWYKGKFMRIKKILKIMFFSIRTVSTLSAIWFIWIKIKPNEKEKQHKIGANRMELQNEYVLQFVKSFTIYYMICVYPRIWISSIYV
jgi:hypothetical protein